MIHDNNNEHTNGHEQSLESQSEPATSDNNIEQFKEQAQKCQQELAHWKDQYMRMIADFENSKKRLERERTAVSRSIKSNILIDLLPILDNFERALKSEFKGLPGEAQAKTGFEMIYWDLAKMLKKQGVEEIPFDKTFNPESHEAVMNVASQQHKSGEVVEILERGYMLNGEILRPAKVSIAL
jgi:molecular chaperone GrpE